MDSLQWLYVIVFKRGCSWFRSVNDPTVVPSPLSRFFYRHNLCIFQVQRFPQIRTKFGQDFFLGEGEGASERCLRIILGHASLQDTA